LGQFDTLEEAINQYALDANRDEKGFNATEEFPLVLSTVHSAKGLEYHTVFVAGCVDGNFPAFFVQKDRDPDASLEEEIRVMYVAITRAQEHLVITLPFEKYSQFQWSGSRNDHKPSPFLPQLGDGVNFIKQEDDILDALQ